MSVASLYLSVTLSVIVALGLPAASVAGAASVSGSGEVPDGESPYVSFTDREIKALSAAAVEEYLAGRGMGLALAAELNGYPGPKHVLELTEELALSPEQVRRANEIFDAMLAEAVELGRRIVDAERQLDRLFATREIDAPTLASSVGEIGRLDGRLRYVHLSAHLSMTELLSEAQRRRYVELRGYSGHGPDRHHSQHHTGEHGR